MKKAVIFDFWGTLIEQGTYSPLKQTYRIMRPRMSFGEFVEKFERACFTKEFPDQKTMFAEAFKTFGMQPKNFLIEKLVGVWNKNKLLAKPFPETKEALKKLKEKSVKLAIISNTPKFSVEDFDKYGINEFFDAIVWSWEHGFLKTDKELFKVVLDELGVKPEEAVMVGDSLQTDIVGAENAGVTPVLIDRRGTREYKNKITSLKEVEKFLEGGEGNE